MPPVERHLGRALRCVLRPDLGDVMLVSIFAVSMFLYRHDDSI